MKWLSILLIFLLSFMATVGASSSFPRIEKGEVDLSAYDFNTKTVRLKGEWIFFWKKTLKGEIPKEKPTFS